ncbi:MAG: C40 family peptidase [Saprospiraceae bacterium]
MIFSICSLSVVPVRAGRKNTSEMVTQLLFGEIVECWERKGDWTKIRCLWDNQIGWVPTNQLTQITPEEADRYQDSYACCMELAQPAIATDHFLPLTMGASLPCFDGMRFEIAGTSYSFSGQVITPQSIHQNIDLLIKLARKYLYAPELEGGRSPFGIDSTGLVQILFKMIGVAMPRDAYLQARKGENIDFYEQSTIGDLVFFQDKNGHINHVGIICEKDKILHTYGQVRIDKIDHFGIFNIDSKKYTHKLRVIKRVLTTQAPTPKVRQKSPSEVTNQIEMFK